LAFGATRRVMNAPTQPDLAKLKIDRQFAPVARKRRRKYWLGGAGLLLVAIAAFFFLQPRVVTVQTTPVVTTYPSQQFVVLNSTGYVVAQRKAAISSKATGRLEWLGVAEGSRVKEGEVIARIDSRDVRAQAQSAEASVGAARAALEQARVEQHNAQIELKRNQDLVAKNFISQSALDTAQARYDRSVAGVANAQATLNAVIANAKNAAVAVDYTEIRAPFDGVILSKSANVGDLVTPFSNATDSKGAVVSMADMSTLEVEADVSESSLSKVRVGQPAEIALDALPDVRFRGHISRMVPTVDRAKATVMTKVRFDAIDPRVLPEMSAKVSFLSQEITPEQQKPLLAVNPDALAKRDGGTVVFVVKNDVATAVAVTPGIKIGDVVSIQGDVKSGDKVVVKPPESLVSGARVRLEGK
jgi:RND family efflux transporter MFP subunit